MIKELVSQLPFTAGYEGLVAFGLTLIAILLLAFLANAIARGLIVRFIDGLLSKTGTKRDDILVRRKVFDRLSQLAPAIVIYALAPAALSDYPAIASFISILSLIYMIVVGILFLDALLNAGLEIYNTFDISKQFPIVSFVQVAKLILYFLGFISVISLILGQSPLTFIAGLGAMTAVLMLVFKDPILGFVAGIQLSTNRMVAVGDWIEMPKYGLDGDVMEIALTTVKVRNFDKTITTVPTQTLINDSFKNWRGMQESGGRRIKRAIHVDISSIRFCDEEMLDRFGRIQYIADYIDQKKQEISAHNQELATDNSTLVNGRRLTNVGTFRAYIEAYLYNHPQISKDMTFLVRQLKPTESGLPIEIYVFSTEKRWIQYESIQADIFDHILAAAKEFDLRIFQNPSGADFQALT